MNAPRDQRQNRFGLLTLVISGVILVGLFLPAIDRGRYGDRRRTQCANNMKNLAIATVNFSTTRNAFPGHQNVFATVPADQSKASRQKIGSWFVALLPYIEQQPLRDRWDDPGEQDNWELAGGGNKTQLDRFYPTISVAICPSDVSNEIEHAPISYACNAGFYVLPNDPALGLDVYQDVKSLDEISSISQRSANGIFCNRMPNSVFDPKTGKMVKPFANMEKPTKPTDVRDGLSQTLLFAERTQNLSWQASSIDDDRSRYELGFLWLYAGDETSVDRPEPMELDSQMRINSGTLENLEKPHSPRNAMPSAFHPGVVTVAFADGSVIQIDEGIDYRVYQALMTPNTRESDVPNRSYLLKEDDYRN